MRRYKFLLKEEVFDALNKVRAALLAAKDGSDVENVMNGLLTFDERMKIGRRIIVAEYLLNGVGTEEISKLLKVGKTTIALVSKNLDDYARCFDLLRLRRKKVETEYKKKAYVTRGGSTMIFKKKEYTGFRRKDVKR